jgi:hypothetical protein
VTTQEDEILKKVVYSVKQQEPLGKEVGVQEYAIVMSELSVIDCVLLRGERLVVPKKLQEKLVEITHEGLQGLTKTKSYLRNRLWFPGMDIMTERIDLLHNDVTRREARGELWSLWSQGGKIFQDGYCRKRMF